MSYSGYDIEDAVVLNRASVDRGFGRMHYMRKHVEKMERYPNGLWDIKNPPPQIRSKKEDDVPPRLKQYRALDIDGVVRVGSDMNKGDIYLNKAIPVPPNRNEIYVRNSEAMNQVKYEE